MRTYNLTGAIVLLAYFILAPLVNYHVDPFGYWGTNRWAYYYSSEREIKRALVRRNHYDGIVMGSSKVANMHTGEILGYRVLNAAWSAGLPEEFCYFLNETDPSVRFVAIGLDLFMFNEDGFPFKEPDAYNPDRRMLDYLISPRLLRRSLQTIRKRIQGAPPRIRPDGSRNYDDGYDADKSFSDEKALQIVQTTFYDGYRFSERRLAKLREIRDHCRRKKIRLVVWVNPWSQPVLDLVNRLPVRHDWIRLKRELKDIFPDLVDLSETYVDRRFYPRHDLTHFLPSVALELFGRYLLPQIEHPEGAQRVGHRGSPLGSGRLPLTL